MDNRYYKDFVKKTVGKTISKVETPCTNVITIRFTDGTFVEIFSECDSTRLPFFEFEFSSEKKDTE